MRPSFSMNNNGKNNKQFSVKPYWMCCETITFTELQELTISFKAPLPSLQIRPAVAPAWEAPHPKAWAGII